MKIDWIIRLRLGVEIKNRALKLDRRTQRSTQDVHAHCGKDIVINVIDTTQKV